MSPSSESFESVREAVCAALWESANCYTSSKRITHSLLAKQLLPCSTKKTHTMGLCS